MPQRPLVDEEALKNTLEQAEMLSKLDGICSDWNKIANDQLISQIAAIDGTKYRAIFDSGVMAGSKTVLYFIVEPEGSILLLSETPGVSSLRIPVGFRTERLERLLIKFCEMVYMVDPVTNFLNRL